MTPDAFLFKTLSKVCDGTYAAYPEQHKLPFFVYKREPGGESWADDANYSLIPRYRVELLMKEKDPSLIERFEAALSMVGQWRLYDADWLDAEGCIDHDYRISLDLTKLREANDG